MSNPWKLATIGLALVMVTAFVTGLTTAYWARPPLTAEAQTALASDARPVAVAPSVPRRIAAASSGGTRAVYRPTPVTAATPSDCATGGDRALRVAKPGVLGTLVGAGLGAAGGAIADGGKGAGRGALIGGIAGAAAGTGYGAYKTKQECGTIFGNSDGTTRTVSSSDHMSIFNVR